MNKHNTIIYGIIWDMDGTLLDTEPLSRWMISQIISKNRGEEIEIDEYISNIS